MVTSYWFLVALFVMRYRVEIAINEPSEMPGGGVLAIVMTGLAWPLIAPFIVVGLIVALADARGMQ
jgi:hypothetical protein